MTTFRGTRWVVATALLLGVVTFAQPRAATRAWITVLGTTDQHGNLLPVDYYTSTPDPRGLASIATLIRRARAENPNGTVLVDSGDLIQGSPLEYVHARINNGPPDPMISAMNVLGYDAMALGNHEYNYGRKVLEKARHEAVFPWLSANTIDTATGQPAYTPYVVKEVQGVRVGILGLTTPGIPYWDDPSNYAGLRFTPAVPEAKKWVQVLRTTERVDVVIIAMHMGMEADLRTGAPNPGQVPNENAALAIAHEVPGVDAIFMGHTHRDVPNAVVNGVVLVQANLWGRHLARVDLFLEQDARRRWRVTAKQSRTIPVTVDVVPDPAITAMAASYDRETQAWLGRTIGSSDAELTAADTRIRDTAILDLVHRVQLEAGQADVSMVASFNARARIPKGDVAVRDIFGLYIYDNTLVVLKVTGAQLKEALEHSARFFRAYEPGRTPAELVDGRVPDYNFDQAEGVSYDLNLTRPPGERIENLRFKGQPVDPAQTFRLATNNYRQNGGGGYTMYQGAQELVRPTREIRDLIVEWVEAHRHIPSEPTNNWRIVTR